VSDSHEQQWAECRKAWAEYTESNKFHPCIEMDDLLTLPDPPVKAYCPGLIYADCLTVLAGDPKEGKSTLLQHAVHAIATGSMFLEQQCERAKVLYCSEQNRGSFKHQAKKIQKLRGLKGVFVIPVEENHKRVEVKTLKDGRYEPILDTEGNPVMQDKPFADWKEQVEFWREQLLRTGARVIVIDTLISFARLKGGDSYDAGAMTALLMELKTLYSSVPGLAIVVLHHCRKEGQWKGGDHEVRKFADMAGSYAIRAASDQNILLFSPDKKNDPRVRTVKVEGRFEMGAEEGFDIRLSPDENDYELVPQLTWGKSLQQEKLHQAYAADPTIIDLTEREIAEKFDVTRHQVRNWKASCSVSLVGQPAS
jgi:RecA-family ATPase